MQIPYNQQSINIQKQFLFLMKFGDVIYIFYICYA